MKEKDHSTYYYIHKTTNVLSVKLDTETFLVKISKRKKKRKSCKNLTIASGENTLLSATAD